MTKQKEIRGWLEHNFHETNARVILDYLHSQGVVIKVEKELPELPMSSRDYDGYERCREDMAGYVAVESLIEEA